MQRDVVRRSSDTDLDETVDTLYRAVLRRVPDAGGRAAYVRLLREGRSKLDLIRLLMESDEFKERILISASENRLLKLDDYDPNNDEEMNRHTTDDVIRLASEMRKPWVSINNFDEATDAAVKMTGGYLGSQIEYLNFHRRRFYEIACALKHMKDTNSSIADVLDFGISINSFILLHLFPELRLHVADRPQIPAPENKFAGTFVVDLLDNELINIRLEKKFDFIVFSEVIEHVLVHPSKIIHFLLRHLKEGGNALLTTPNLFSREKMRRISMRRNPLELFPPSYTQADTPHFHVREYTMTEILSAVDSCDGYVRTFFFSGCWDDVNAADTIPQHELSNLVVLFGNR